MLVPKQIVFIFAAANLEVETPDKRVVSSKLFVCNYIQFMAR